MSSSETVVRITDRTKNNFSLAYALGYAIEWKADGEHIQIYSHDRMGNRHREQIIMRRNLFLWLFKYHDIRVTSSKPPMDPDVNRDRSSYYKNWIKTNY